MKSEQTTKKIMHQALIVDQDPLRQHQITEAIDAENITIITASSVTDAALIIGLDDIEIIILNRDLIAEAQILFQKTKSAVILTSSLHLATDLSLLANYQYIKHILYYDRINPRLFQMLLKTTVSKIIDNNPFGLSRYLPLNPAIAIDIDETYPRQFYIENVKAFLKNIGVNSQTITTKVGLICEELMTNAIYLKSDPKSSSTITTNQRGPCLAYSSNDEFLGVSVTDYFGSLELSLIINYLKSCLSGKYIQSSAGHRRGGLGIFEILSSCDAFIVNSIQGKKTEIIAIVDIHSVQKSLKNLSALQFFAQK